ncbi:hypothetical protein LA080_016303 [Diaporthe eres]|nr:hypothetical protein LA080_016303 [Diaporthe eres]
MSVQEITVPFETVEIFIDYPSSLTALALSNEALRSDYLPSSHHEPGHQAALGLAQYPWAPDTAASATSDAQQQEDVNGLVLNIGIWAREGTLERLWLES